LQPAFERCGKVSHALTAVQPGNQLRLTNFVEMTCPLFAAACLGLFLEGFDGALKGWGADWWFLTSIARQRAADADAAAAAKASGALISMLKGAGAELSKAEWSLLYGPMELKGRCAIVDAITCLNPTEMEKAGVREIDALQSREARRVTWQRILEREAVTEWRHAQFGDPVLLAEDFGPLATPPAEAAVGGSCFPWPAAWAPCGPNATPGVAAVEVLPPLPVAIKGTRAYDLLERPHYDGDGVLAPLLPPLPPAGWACVPCL
jgi:hypothetical protein